MRRAKALWSVLAALVLLWMLVSYVSGAEHHLHRVNVDSGRTDQNGYLRYARQMDETDYAFVGGRNRMPVFPFLASLLHEPGLSNDEFFIRVKYLNLGLSLVLLPCVWLLARSALPALEATLLALVAAFTVYVYKAAYAQAELLFYTLNFAAFVGCVHLLRRPAPALAAGVGVVLGLAHLTKASVLPLLFLWTGWSVIGALVRRTGRSSMVPALTVALFLVTVFPYIHTSKQVFGQWFYNVNSTFYVWYDSWGEATRGTRAAGDRLHWPDLPAEQIPGPLKYVREHDAGEVFDRLTHGFRVLGRHLTSRFGYDRYVMIYALFCFAVAMRHLPAAREVLWNDHRWLVSGFAASTLAAYAILYAFYVPIAAGPRLMLAQLLPLLFCMLAFLSRPALRGAMLLPGRPPFAPWHLSVGMLALVLYDVAFRVPTVVRSVYAGN